MEISVIIPVYNAADYIREVVESALMQPETAEVVLVEDNSTDDSLARCQELAAADSRVKLYRHQHQRDRLAVTEYRFAAHFPLQQRLSFALILVIDPDILSGQNRFNVYTCHQAVLPLMVV